MQQAPALNHGLVMIVDDDPTLCDYVSMALDEQGYRTVTAGDGTLALDMIARELPSLILTDGSMPHLGGHEFAARVRESWGGRVPLVIMSGSSSPPAERADEAVSAYLPKPFDLDALLKMVERYACRPEAAQGS